MNTRSSLYNKSRTSKYHNLYWYYVDRIKSKGIKLEHKPLRRYLWAEYDDTKKTITVDRKIAGKLSGLIVLLHEYRHALHCEKKMYRRFYKTLKFTKKDIPLIWKVEWDCFLYARNTLKKDLGYSPNHVFINKKFVKTNCFPEWIKNYL